MKPRTLLAALAVLTACNPYKALRPAHADLPGAGDIALRVPKGFKEARTDQDGAGHPVRSWHYNDGTVFYVALVPNGGDLQPINHSQHVPKVSAVGDTLFKELGGKGRYWREDRKGQLRVGYINVDEGEREALFDSAVNYVKRR